MLCYTALHTLAECQAWALHRRELVAAVGMVVLSLPFMVLIMLRSEGFWNAVASSCEQIMLIEESADRNRERRNSLPNGRTGRWRVRDDLPNCILKNDDGARAWRACFPFRLTQRSDFFDGARLDGELKPLADLRLYATAICVAQPF